MRTQELKNSRTEKVEGADATLSISDRIPNGWFVVRAVARGKNSNPEEQMDAKRRSREAKIQNKHHGNAAVLALHLSFYLSFSLILLWSLFTLQVFTLDSSLFLILKSPLPTIAQKQCNHFDPLISAIRHGYFYFSDFSEKRMRSLIRHFLSDLTKFLRLIRIWERKS